MELVKNCFNYIGSKDRIMPQVLDNLNTSKSIFIDLFCGSGVVGVNVAKNFNYDLIIMNDACWQVVEILKYFRDNDDEAIMEALDSCINKYNLSKDNKEGYLKLRDDFNDNVANGKWDYIMLYALITHSFNYNIVFNSSEFFNVPSGAGRCWFNPSLRKKLTNFIKELKTNNSYIKFSSFKFNAGYVYDTFSGLNDNEMFKDMMVYADPPYFCSDASHSRIYGLKWTENEERALYDYLDKLNEHGGSFLLSNLVCDNGIRNTLLENWMSKYKVVEVEMNYANCCYQKNQNRGETREVMVKNY